MQRPAASHPKFTARMEPKLKALLDAASVILGISANQLICEALEEHLAGLPRKQRTEIERLAETIVARYE